jgi:hypothetical protein
MDLSDLVTALSGGATYREKSGLPEFEDFPTYAKAANPDVLQMQNLLIQKALSDKYLKAGLID